MSYRNLISCHVSDATAEAFASLARARDTTIAALLRDMIERELGPKLLFDKLARDYVLFAAIGVDALLQTHAEPDLRSRALEAWRQRVAELDGNAA